MPTDPSRPGSASLGSRDMYGSMSGYMPNGYHGYDTSMYSQPPYGSSHMSSSPSSLYASRYDMSNMYSPSSTTASAMSSYMNGSYMTSMYAGANSGSPYSSMAGGPMSPEEGEGVVAHPSHSPGSVKSEAGAGPGSGPPTGSSGSGVSMSSGSPGSAPLGSVPPPAGSGGPPPPTVKREPMSGPGGAALGGGDLNHLIAQYLPPGAAEAAAAGDVAAQSRIQALYQQHPAFGHYSSLGMTGSHSPDPMSLPPPPSTAYPV